MKSERGACRHESAPLNARRRHQDKLKYLKYYLAYSKVDYSGAQDRSMPANSAATPELPPGGQTTQRPLVLPVSLVEDRVVAAMALALPLPEPPPLGGPAGEVVVPVVVLEPAPAPLPVEAVTVPAGVVVPLPGVAGPVDGVKNGTATPAG